MLSLYNVFGFVIAFECLCFLHATKFYKTGEFDMATLQKLPEAKGDHFYYFAYGSDMLFLYLNEIVSNPKMVGSALLQYHRLDFNMKSQQWNGALATIEIDVTSDIYGTLWEVSLDDFYQLNQLESSSTLFYVPYRTPVFIVASKEVVIARTFYLRENPLDSIYNFPGNQIPSERLPSATYLKAMVMGAEENRLPAEYIEFLKNLKHNGQTVPVLDHELHLDKIDLKI